MSGSGASVTGETAVTLSPDWLARPSVQRLMQVLGADGVDARFVGGCVRDTVIGTDVVDIDIGVPLPPEAVTERLAAAGIKVVPTGLAHGTVTAVLDGEGFEVTSLRQDVETDGRRAVVQYTTDWREDALRRDFTINALSMNSDGAVFDYFGGIADLDARTVRFVGVPEERIREDALRILRFYRFVSRFGLAGADPVSRDSCRGLAALVRDLSRERISQELLKTLTARHAADAVAALIADDVLDQAVVAPWSPDRFTRMIALEEALDLPADAGRRLVALIADPVSVEPAVRSLRPSTKMAERLLAMVQHEPDAATWWQAESHDDDRQWRVAFYRHGAERWRDATLLACAGDTGTPDTPRLRALVDAAAAWTPPKLPVRGADLVARGITGPAVGKGLDFIERWWIANDFTPGRAESLDKLEEAVALVRALSENGA